MEFPEDPPGLARDAPDYLDELEALLRDATRLRLRADVPVGAYLSGGLDSSLVASFVREEGVSRLETFSVAFADPAFDERRYQERMSRALETSHQVVKITASDIGTVFPDVVWHTEVPLLRTAPAPLFLLSRAVCRSGYKVVLTGEGADEFFGGYDIFKETKLRRFWARQPHSTLRPRLLRRLYPYISGLSKTSEACLIAFFRHRLLDVDRPDYSHAIRWRNAQRTHRFFADEIRRMDSQGVAGPMAVEYPGDFSKWDWLQRAQYLESTIFLSHYLLSSQGDRMAMAHSVEGRYPFLDHRMVAFANGLPTDIKIRGLEEKAPLRRLGRRWLPEEIWQRRKHPYRAPIQACFLGKDRPAYVDELLRPGAIKSAGFFGPGAVRQLVAKAIQGSELGETDEMALVGILSPQLLHRLFVEDFQTPVPVKLDPSMKICATGHTGRLSEL